MNFSKNYLTAFNFFYIISIYKHANIEIINGLFIHLNCNKMNISKYYSNF